jgi:predicted nucleic acid-binding protein
MNDKILIDTNLWIYLYSKNPSDKYNKVKEVVNNYFNQIIVSTQVLGELYNTLTKKKLQTKEDAEKIVVEMITTFPIIEVDSVNILKAIEINHRYEYSYWDSSIIATALLNNCHTFYSEDMQHNQMIEKCLRIKNPFKL